MHKYFMATAFVFALATPALAAPFYVGLDLETKQCHVYGAEARRHDHENGRQRRYTNSSGGRAGNSQPD